MMKQVTCSECGLNYGRYSEFHRFPDVVEAERRRHNCRLIKLCAEWQGLYRRLCLFDPNTRGQSDTSELVAELAEAEHRAAVAGARFEARAAAYQRAEARACSRIFAAARADRNAATDAAAAAAAAEAERDAALARANLAAKAVALDRAMDAVEECAREAGLWLLPPRGGVLRAAGGGGGGGRIVFADVDDADDGDRDDDYDTDHDDSDEYVESNENNGYHGFEDYRDDDYYGEFAGRPIEE